MNLIPRESRPFGNVIRKSTAEQKSELTEMEDRLFAISRETHLTTDRQRKREKDRGRRIGRGGRDARVFVTS